MTLMSLHTISYDNGLYLYAHYHGLPQYGDIAPLDQFSSIIRDPDYFSAFAVLNISLVYFCICTPSTLQILTELQENA